MKFKIEQAIDYHELAKLNETVQTWHHENYPDEFKPFDFYEIENTMKKMIKDENAFAFIASHENKFIGYILGYEKTRADSAFQYEKKILYIDQIAVIQDYQKMGIGQLLINETYKLARNKKVKEIQLDFWKANQEAESFFMKNGFKYFNHKMRKLQK